MQTYQEETHQFLQLQNQRLVQTLLEQRNQHVESLLNNFQAKVAVLLKAKDDKLTIVMMRQQELQEKLKNAEESKAMWESNARQNDAHARFCLSVVCLRRYNNLNSPLRIRARINSNSPMEVKKKQM